MRLKLSEINSFANGKIINGGDPVITDFATDSRECKEGVMFVPIRGERADGHDYIAKAFENGASASFADHEVEAEGPVSVVADCREALQKTAAGYRSRFDIPIVGITGSVGKTTMKEMTAQALSARFNVHKTPGNRNSQVGVPVTVCGITEEHSAAVIEMGVSMPGEMGRISSVVKPTCAIMTNIGVSHIEYMKTRENILKEKSHIADYLPEDGVVFVNGDDDLLPTLRETLDRKVMTYGTGEGCDYRASDLNETENGTRFTLTFPDGKSAEVFVPAAGEHNVRNASAALAAAVHLGVPAEDAVRAIGEYKAPAMRQQIFEADGVTVIDDSYNASPDSMRSALDVLSSRDISGRRIAVLADMLELGSYSDEGHIQTGRYAREKCVDVLIAIGPLAKKIAEGYGEGALWFASNSEATAYLTSMLKAGDAVLIKGSRGMKTDEIVDVLKGE